MKNKGFWRIAPVLVMVAICCGSQAQSAVPLILHGTINDYSPSTVVPPGPWEIRGDWTLILKPTTSSASFTAALTMVRSDYWVIQNSSTVDDPSQRVPHTHHITVSGKVTSITNGFELAGTATVTANVGAPAFGLSVPVVIDVTGGANVAYSNIKLSFGSPADGHFGTEPLEGVVLK